MTDTPAKRNCVFELLLTSSNTYPDPYNEVELDIELESPSGRILRHPAFWAGGNRWKARLTGEEVGAYQFRTVSNQTTDAGLHGHVGTMTVEDYNGPNPIIRRGRLRVAPEKNHFQYADGTPFYWQGDTWWMGLCARLDFPEGFGTLAADRVAKHFNVIQIVVGPYPDMDEWDDRGRNEAGFPFTEGYASINPAYYDMADQRIESLVHWGLSPCLVGMWGYYLPRIGVDRIKKFWRYIVARYGAYPVTWCLAGEGAMPYYLSKTREEDKQAQITGWTEVGRYVREIDGYKNLVTIHPTRYGREMVDDPSVIDFEMLQTGHSDTESVPSTAKAVVHSVPREPKMPVIVSEVNYEGILGRCWQNVQRYSFFAGALHGSAGHTYGANGIWQVNLEGQPYGPSPHGRSWGDTPWREAADLPGSAQIGYGAHLLRRFEWWKIESHPEWIDPPTEIKDAYSIYAAGIPGKVRLIYVPSLWDPPKLTGFEPGTTYTASYYDPTNGKDIPIGPVEPDAAGAWKPPYSPSVHDWVVVLTTG